MKNYSLLLLVFFFSIGLKAQESQSLSLNVYGGYNFSDEVDFDFGYARVEDSFQYGVGLEYFVQKNSSVELSYYRTDTDMPFYRYNGELLNGGDMKGALNYILIGGKHYFENSSSSKLKPYFGGGLGVGIIETPQSGNDTNFAWDIKLGVKIKTPSAVSVCLQAYLQSMTAAVGSDVYYDPWYGPLYVTDYVSTYQFGLGAVISFNFEGNNF